MKENTREISILKRRILEYLESKGVSKYECYKNTGITNGVLSQPNGLSEDNLMRFLSYYHDVSYSWLFTGRGSMLKQNVQNETNSAQITGNALISSDKDKQKSHINQEESSYLYKIYQEEKSEWKEEKREKDTLLKEKDTENKHLQSELLAKSEELAVLKAQYPHESPPDAVIEEIREVLGPPRTAKHADTKPHSSTYEPSARSVQPHQENQ